MPTQIILYSSHPYVLHQSQHNKNHNLTDCHLQ